MADDTLRAVAGEEWAKWQEMALGEFGPCASLHVAAAGTALIAKLCEHIEKLEADRDC